MPAYHNSQYRRPSRFFSGHWETIYPVFFRKIRGFSGSVRERIETPDEDFLDLDWWKSGSKRLVIIQHGLEGSSDRPYVLGMARHFFNHGYDALGWNFRGCSGELNRNKRFYHSGATDDLETVVNHAAKDYEEIVLIGFSLGGNLVLKYVGEKDRPSKIKKVVAISVPLDLDACAENLKKRSNFVYENRFLNNLKAKVKQKSLVMPNDIDTTHFKKLKTLRDFDEYYTAPLHGFQSATDYYKKCSSMYFLEGIKVPTLILNALNDPLLTSECLDPDLTTHLSQVHLETSSHGGHVGFIQFDKEGTYWSEQRALEFCAEN